MATKVSVCVANAVNTKRATKTEEHAKVASYVMVAFKSAIMTRVAGGSKCVILLVVKHEAGVDWAGM